MVIIGFLLFFSCSGDDEKDFPFSSINLNHYENFSNHERELVFYLETLDSFPCSNFQIAVNMHSSPLKIDIHADNIDVPSHCVTIIGPATRSILLGKPEENPPSISFWVNDKRHDFDLKISEEAIELNKKTIFENHLFFTREVLMRIPANTVWGYIYADTTDKNVIPAGLMEAFTALGAQVLELPDGDYYYFKVVDNSPWFSLGDEEIMGFSMWFDKGLDLLIAAFEQFAQENEELHYKIRLFNTQGQRFLI
ncbi:MAG: hypothetical protein EA393_10440 [Bacteroidetes bacterium]|nr:MAG: hypothetical protein EA393_10440 [Bacteroidota bacterium]